MSIEENKALARRASEIWRGGDASVFYEIFAPEYVNHQHGTPDGPRDLVGVEAWKDFVTKFREGFSDFHDTIASQIGEGDLVTTRFTASGTQTGPFLGLTPSNRRASFSGIAIHRIEGGKIVESWTSWDMIGMLQQLGTVSWSN